MAIVSSLGISSTLRWHSGDFGVKQTWFFSVSWSRLSVLTYKMQVITGCLMKPFWEDQVRCYAVLCLTVIGT